MTTPWYEIAEGDLGVAEVPGPAAHERILKLAKSAGIDWYKSDETAWCAIAVGGWLQEAGYTPSGSALLPGGIRASRSAKTQRAIH